MLPTTVRSTALLGLVIAFCLTGSDPVSARPKPLFDGLAQAFVDLTTPKKQRRHRSYAAKPKAKAAEKAQASVLKLPAKTPEEVAVVMPPHSPPVLTPKVEPAPEPQPVAKLQTPALAEPAPEWEGDMSKVTIAKVKIEPNPYLNSKPEVKVEKPGSVQDLVIAYAQQEGISSALAYAVAKHESGANPSPRRGAAGEYGTMQIKCQTARGIGFRGSCSNLQNTETNIRWGVKYLAQAWQKAGGNECLALSKYNGGHGRKSLIKTYCKGVQAAKR